MDEMTLDDPPPPSWEEAVEFGIRELEVPNAPPSLPTIDETIQAGDAAIVWVQPFDADDDPLTVAVHGLPAGARYDPFDHTIRWTPRHDQVGVYLLDLV